MNSLLSPKFFLVFLLALGFVGIAAAQDGLPANGAPPADGGPKAKRPRPNLLRILGLSPEQMQQVRKMNQERKPLMEAATQRLRAANRALDEAIYADNIDQAAFQAKLKELQAAQAEVARLRFTSELEVRKILTPDQLTRFRDLRQRLQQEAVASDSNLPPPDNQARPLRPARNAFRQKPPN
ncbi:MAG TPA: Spy/CpxP family protein refolding chaperone [Pyrinomonadaceae bacterium]|nr:Spy/CpxP family protein refolding chaperone [Pyrinomonadaceae bacterium]